MAQLGAPTLVTQFLLTIIREKTLKISFQNSFQSSNFQVVDHNHPYNYEYVIQLLKIQKSHSKMFYVFLQL